LPLASHRRYPPLRAALETRALTATDVPATPFVTDPRNCTVAPRALDEVRRLIVRSKQAEATPVVTPSSVPITKLPSGTAADAETVAAIAATTQQFFACLNAGDLFRFLALLSDDAVISLDRELGIPFDDPSIATPRPRLDSTPIILSAIGEVRMLRDGRAGVLVTPASLMRGPIFFYFFRQSDRWLVDGFVDVVQEPTKTTSPCCATPSPHQ
jgi:hypothetical protein